MKVLKNVSVAFAVLTLTTIWGCQENNSSNENSSGWQCVGKQRFMTDVDVVSIALDGHDVPYVSFLQSTKTQGESVAMMLRLDGDEWTALGGKAFTTVWGALSMAVTEQGTPWLACEINDKGIMRFDGDGWISTGATGLNQGNSPVIAVDHEGTVHVVYSDMDKDGLSVFKYKDGAWQAVGTTGFAKSLFNNGVLSFDRNNKPYLAFDDDASEGSATVMMFDDDAWKTLGKSGFTDSYVSYMGLVFDSKNTPYLSYTDYGNGDNAVVVSFDGTEWSPVGEAGFSDGKAYEVDLAIGDDDVLYAAYTDNANKYEATVMKFDGGTWRPLGNKGFSNGDAGEQIRVVVTGDNTLYVTVRETGHFKALTIMKYMQ